ncbi:MBL fold metallo-hydrolase [Clostridiaceae bacterium]|nr:MBL fold metallo-hydrolase [Clostridiaceae bacterium]RKI10432.1 MBL fold metallo-hydrolase [bacterium 1XD21-70]
MIRDYIYDVSGDCPGNVYLGAGETSVLFDAGMACCGEQMAERAASVLRGRPLDYVFLTHSHFDHVSGVPFVRKRWPGVKVYIAPHGRDILKKPSALRRIRELNEAAAADQGIAGLSYEDEALHVDGVLADRQVFQLNEWRITAVETPGHTRDSFSFLVERKACGERMLVCAETAGVYMEGRHLSPCFLLGYHMSMDSVAKLRGIGADVLLFAHSGFAPESNPDDTWKRCIEEHEQAVRRIRAEAKRDILVEDKLKNLAEYYWPESIRKYQPYQAYAVNMESMLKKVGQEEWPGEL